MIHGFATIKFLFLPEQHAHGTAACIGEQHAWGGMGRTRYSQSTMILCGQAAQTTQEAVCSGGATCSGKQYARGSSITGSYIASLHEIEDNFVFASIWGTAPHIAKKTVGNSSYCWYGGIIKSHFQTSLSSISSKIAIWRTLLCYSPLACCFPLALLLPLSMLLPLCMLLPLGMMFPSGHAAVPWASCATCGRSPVRPIYFEAGSSCSSSF
jgi:hypothetical protein